MIRLRKIGSIPWTALKNWSRDDVPRLGASLAYKTLVSIAPVLIVAIGIGGLVFGADAMRGHITGLKTAPSAHHNARRGFAVMRNAALLFSGMAERTHFIISDRDPVPLHRPAHSDAVPDIHPVSVCHPCFCRATSAP